MTFLQVLWFILIFVLIAGYFVLDGFDLGVGVLYPFLGKSDGDKALLRRIIGPVWDGNEVWLLTAGGALFAAFAPAYACTFSGFYLAIMLVLFGLIVRAVSLELYAHDKGNGHIWDALFFVGSLLPALLFGVAVGNVIEGIVLNANGDYTGGFFALLNPFALVCGVLGLAQCLLQGAAWVALKTLPGRLHSLAVALRKTLALSVLVIFGLATLAYFTLGASAAAGSVPLAARIACVCVIVLLLVACMLLRNASDLVLFACSSLVCVGLVALTATTLFPNIVPATDAALSITVAGAASSDAALSAMTVITCIGLPLVLLYHFLVYRSFAGRVSSDDAAE